MNYNDSPGPNRSSLLGPGGLGIQLQALSMQHLSSHPALALFSQWEVGKVAKEAPSSHSPAGTGEVTIHPPHSPALTQKPLD